MSIDLLQPGIDHRRNRLAQAVFVVVLLVFAAAPFAEAAVIPPDNSAADQYTEGFPGARGNEQPRKDQTGGKKPSPIKPSVVKDLEAAGPDGSEAVAVAVATAPIEIDTASGNKTGRNGEGPKAESAPTTNFGDGVEGTGGLPEIAEETLGGPGDGGVGLWLPLILLATAALAVAYAVRAKRTR